MEAAAFPEKHCTFSANWLAVTPWNIAASTSEDSYFPGAASVALVMLFHFFFKFNYERVTVFVYFTTICSSDSLTVMNDRHERQLLWFAVTL